MEEEGEGRNQVREVSDRGIPLQEGNFGGTR
jgi:hypothetical protein